MAVTPAPPAMVCPCPTWHIQRLQFRRILFDALAVPRRPENVAVTAAAPAHQQHEPTANQRQLGSRKTRPGHRKTQASRRLAVRAGTTQTIWRSDRRRRIGGCSSKRRPGRRVGDTKTQHPGPIKLTVCQAYVISNGRPEPGRPLALVVERRQECPSAPMNFAVWFEAEQTPTGPPAISSEAPWRLEPHEPITPGEI